MKRIAIIVSFLLIFAVIVCGCGSSSPATTAAPSSQPAAPAQTQPSPDKEVYNWRMANFIPKLPYIWDYFDRFTSYSKGITDGRVNITLYPGGQIVPVTEMWDAVSSGALEMCYGYGGMWTGKTPMAYISYGLPFTMNSLADADAQIFQLKLEELVRAEYMKHNLYLLALYPAEEVVLFTNFPVNKVEDLKGHKMRLVGTLAEIAPSLGASATFIPVPDIYMSMEQGVIDGITSSRQAAISAKYAEVSKYFCMPAWQPYTGDEILINLDLWNSLPDDVKAQLRAAAMSTYVDRVSWLAYVNQRAEQTLQNEFKLTKTVLPESEIQKLADAAWPVYDKYAAASPEFAEALKIIKDYDSLSK